MDFETLTYMSSITHKLTAIPITIFEDGKELPVAEFGISEDREQLFSSMFQKLLAQNGKAIFTLNGQSLNLCSMKCLNSPYTVIYGPIKILNFNSSMLREFLIENNIPLVLADSARKQIDALPTLRFEYFAILCSSFYCNLNHTVVTANELLDQVTYDADLNFQNSLLSKHEQIVFGEAPQHNTYEYEKKLLYCVRNGLTEEIQKLGDLTNESHVAIISQDPLRHYKSLIFAQKTLISRAAIEGGIDPETAFQLSDIYSQKIEGAHSMNDISALSLAMRKDYCELVKEAKYPQTDDLTVNRAIAYIREHVHEKISAAEIAESLGITSEYLATKFKKKMNRSIPEYIGEQKIAVACKLLRFTEKPLIEISNYLSFSSQSYFQTTFKKVTGMTPLEYKDKSQ